MRIGVLSDTHGSVPSTRAAVRMLESLEVEAILHCGDIGTPDIVELLRPWPAHYVLGNCDYDPAPLREAIEREGQTFCGEFGEIELAGVRIALLHSHRRQQFDEAKGGDRYDLVCYGHTHVAKRERIGETLVLNPGALHRANPHSIAVVELPSLEATIVPL